MHDGSRRAPASDRSSRRIIRRYSMVVRLFLLAVVLLAGFAPRAGRATARERCRSSTSRSRRPPCRTRRDRSWRPISPRRARAYKRNPDDVEAAIWLGRRTAYLGRFTEAIEIYTRAIETHPDEPRLYRHRGHRYITIRKPDLAIKDLQKAAELVEGSPDQARARRSAQRSKRADQHAADEHLLPPRAGALPEGGVPHGARRLPQVSRAVEESRHAGRDHGVALHDVASEWG